MAVIPNRWLIDIAVVAGALAAIYGYGVYQRSEGRVEERIKCDAGKAVSQAAAIAKNADTAGKMGDLSANQVKNQDAEHERTKKLEADYAATTSELERLRVALRSRPASSGRVSAHSSAVCQCETDTSASDLFLRCAARYTELGKRADEDRAAGLACNDQYDAAFKACGVKTN